jgi:hypothetical protein
MVPFSFQHLGQVKGNYMGQSNKAICQDLLLDLICYEIRSRRLSPEMEYILEKHLEQCTSCRCKIHGFQRTIQDARIVRNFG